MPGARQARSAPPRSRALWTRRAGESVWTTCARRPSGSRSRTVSSSLRGTAWSTHLARAAPFASAERHELAQVAAGVAGTQLIIAAARRRPKRPNSVMSLPSEVIGRAVRLDRGRYACRQVVLRRSPLRRTRRRTLLADAPCRASSGCGPRAVMRRRRRTAPGRSPAWSGPAPRPSSGAAETRATTPSVTAQSGGRDDEFGGKGRVVRL